MIDLKAVVRDHPALIADILANSSGPLGELLVARKLQEQGFSVDVLNGHDQQRDLRVEPPDGEPFFVETKTVRVDSHTRSGRPPSVTWWANTKPDSCLSQFWILVITVRPKGALPSDEDVFFYVLTTEEAAHAWKQSDDNPQYADLRTGRLPTGCENAFEKLQLRGHKT